MNAPLARASFRPPRLPNPGWAGLRHLPGDSTLLMHLPMWDTARFLRDPLTYTRRQYERHGPVFRVNHFGGWSAVLIGPDALELTLFDRDRIFSSEQGWGPILHRLFPRGLMLMDFDEHRVHRKALGVAFKPEPMRAYLGALNPGIAERVERWRAAGRIRAYPEIKALTLDLAATSFLGIPWGPEADRINRAFVDMVQAAVGLVRVPLPFTKMRRGVAGRRFMSAFFAREIAARRGRAGDDMFTQICNAVDEEGQPLGDQTIIDHMNFLMMAAHDTLTSSLTATMMLLAQHPHWQERLHDEAAALGEASLRPERLGDLPLAELVFREALRLYPPVPSLPRCALAPFHFAGHDMPAGTHVGINPMLTHRLAEHWPEPDAFRPERHTPEASRGRHRYAWVPFGGGAHMCLGLHFAMMQAKCFLFHLLSRARIELEPGAGADWQLFPMPKPRDGLPVRLVAH
jgi:cytochrome P450